MPSSLSHVEQVVENQSVQYRQPVQNMSRTVNYEAHSTNTLVDGVLYSVSVNVSSDSIE